jgi:hypothetical protein
VCVCVCGMAVGMQREKACVEMVSETEIEWRLERWLQRTRRGSTREAGQGAIMEEADASIENKDWRWRLVVADETTDREKTRHEAEREIHDDGKHTHNGKRNNNNKKQTNMRERMGGGDGDERQGER